MTSEQGSPTHAPVEPVGEGAVRDDEFTEQHIPIVWPVVRTVLLGLTACVVVALIVWTWTMDQRITSVFAHSLTAQKGLVYAKSVTLERDQVMPFEELVSTLDDLGYQSTPNPETPGFYNAQGTSSGSEVRLVTRPFEFVDAAQKALALTVKFRGQHILSIHDSSGVEIDDVVSLDPKLLGSVAPGSGKDSRPIPYESIPRPLIDTLLAVEDRSFFSHFGVDVKGIVRAALANFRAGKIEQGASTITQQLARSHFLDRDRNFVRKANEALMAIIMEVRFSKEQILEGYINEVYLGQSGSRGIHGFGLASQFYFGRPVNELTVGQTAMLVAMVRGPSAYNPRRRPQKVVVRRNIVLTQLGEYDDKYSAGLIAEAKKAPLGILQQAPGVANTFAFDNYVREQLNRRYENAIDRGQNLSVFSTLDPAIQRIAEQSLSNGLTEIESDPELEASNLEGAVVVVGVKDGRVHAIVGGRKAGFAGFNRALDAKRPIGSLVKPAIFLTALENTDRYSLRSRVEDSRFQIPARNGNVWRPQNFSQREYGKVTLLRALANSYNLASARLGLDVGVQSVNHTINRLGVDTDPDPFPSLLLGAVEMTPLEVAQMYQTIANAGRRIPIHPVVAIRQEGDKKIIPAPVIEDVVTERVPARRIVRALQEVMTTGTGRRAADDFSKMLKLAGKTGTTNNLRDSWFAGFSGNYLTVVWVGRDDNQPAGVTGSQGALNVWRKVMRGLHLQPVVNGSKLKKKKVIAKKKAKCEEGKVIVSSTGECEVVAAATTRPSKKKSEQKDQPATSPGG